MATSETSSKLDKLAPAWDFLLSGRPLVGLVAVMLTTTGHTMNLRELADAQGWVAAEFYILQSSLLAGIALTLLVCPALGQHLSSRAATQMGLVLVAAGSFLNGLAIWSPFSVFVAGRIVVAVGAGLVIYFTPRLLQGGWQPVVTWATILCPVAGPGVIAAFTMSRGVRLAMGLSLEGVPSCPASLAVNGSDSQSHPRCARLAGLFAALALAAVALRIVSTGDARGLAESLDIVIMSSILLAALLVSLLLAWPQLDFPFYARIGPPGRVLLWGACHSFHSFTMNTPGGLIVNFSSWQRTWLIWPMPIGIAARWPCALAVARSQNLRLLCRRRTLVADRRSLPVPPADDGLAILANTQHARS